VIELNVLVRRLDFLLLIVAMVVDFFAESRHMLQELVEVVFGKVDS
jgi:hypothetical protein